MHGPGINAHPHVEFQMQLNGWYNMSVVSTADLGPVTVGLLVQLWVCRPPLISPQPADEVCVGRAFPVAVYTGFDFFWQS